MSEESLDEFGEYCEIRAFDILEAEILALKGNGKTHEEIDEYIAHIASVMLGSILFRRGEKCDYQNLEVFMNLALDYVDLLRGGRYPNPIKQ